MSEEVDINVRDIENRIIAIRVVLRSLYRDHRAEVNCPAITDLYSLMATATAMVDGIKR